MRKVLTEYEHCDLWTGKMMKGAVKNLALSAQRTSR
jgi:hypothetical protein